MYLHFRHFVRFLDYLVNDLPYFCCFAGYHQVYFVENFWFLEFGGEKKGIFWFLGVAAFFFGSYGISEMSLKF